jgi:hypothetical protein
VFGGIRFTGRLGRALESGGCDYLSLAGWDLLGLTS